MRIVLRRMAWRARKKATDHNCAAHSLMELLWRPALCKRALANQPVWRTCQGSQQSAKMTRAKVNMRTASLSEARIRFWRSCTCE